MTEISDVRAELSRAIGDAYTAGFHYSFREARDHTRASLINPAVGDILALAEDTPSLVLNYSTVRNAEGGAQTSKSELLRTPDGVVIRHTDVATGKLLAEVDLPAASEHDDDHVFDTLQECIAAFQESEVQAQFQAEANKTCRTQYPHLHCCLRNGNCFSVVLIVRPTSWKCLVSVAYDPAEFFTRLDR